MVEIMEASLNFASVVFGRCDTCLRNMQKSICALNCSPKQSDFMTTETAEAEVNGKKGKIS